MKIRLTVELPRFDLRAIREERGGRGLATPEEARELLEGAVRSELDALRRRWARRRVTAHRPVV